MSEEIAGAPAPVRKKRLYFLSKEVIAKKKAEKEARAKKKAYAARKKRLKAQKKESIERRKKPVVDSWAGRREQYALFMQDVLLPRANIEWTKLSTIMEAYSLYCKAVGQPEEITLRGMALLLRENFMWKYRGEGTDFGLVLKDVFVKVEDEIKINS